MIIIMKPDASKEAVKKVTDLIEGKGLQPHLSEGSQVTIVGVVGDKTKLMGSNIEMSEGVDKVVSVTESYKLCLLYTSSVFSPVHTNRSNTSYAQKE